MAPAPSPSPKGSPGRSLGARLGRKVGPLPVWLWAAAILGAYLLYTRLHPSTATTPATASAAPGNTTGADTSGGVGSVGTDLSAVTAQLGSLGASVDANAAQVGTLGASVDANAAQVGTLGSSIDANTGQVGALGSSVDALTYQIMTTQPPSAGSNGAPPGAGASSGSTGGAGPAAVSTPAPAQAAAAAGHLTQTSAGSLSWGGLTFTTKAAFNRWASAHGTSATKEFAAHPQAKAIYSTLR